MKSDAQRQLEYLQRRRQTETRLTFWLANEDVGLLDDFQDRRQLTSRSYAIIELMRLGMIADREGIK